MTEFHAAGELPKLFLGNGGHNGQAQFRISLQCEDIVVLEKYAHTALQQLPGKANGIQGVTGKPGDLLGDDEIKKILRSVLDHPVKVLPLLRGDAGQTLINVARDIGPVLIPLDQILVIGDLVSQRVQLLVTLGGHTGIERDPHGNVIDGSGFELLRDRMNVHGGLLAGCCIMIIFTWIIQHLAEECNGKNRTNEITRKWFTLHGLSNIMR